MNKKKIFIEFILLKLKRLRYNDLNSSSFFHSFFFLDFSIIDYPWKNSRESKKEEGKPITKRMRKRKI